MVESVVKLQGKLPSQPSITAGDQAASRPVAEHGPLRPPPATYLPRSEMESQVTSALIGIDKLTNARPGPHDSEKEPFERRSQHSHNLPYNHSRLTYIDREDDRDDDGPQEHTIWILVGSSTSGTISSHQHARNQQIYLSVLAPLLALPIALYTLVIGTLLLLLFPLCFCLKQSPISARFRHSLSPLLVFQLGLVYSSYDIDDPVRSETSGVVVLFLVSMLSPLYAMAIAVATWIAGVFWFYTAILGNPNGREDRDDGREAVLAVRGWWERWLIQSLEPEDHSTIWDNDSEIGC